MSLRGAAVGTILGLAAVLTACGGGSSPAAPAVARLTALAAAAAADSASAGPAGSASAEAAGPAASSSAGLSSAAPSSAATAVAIDPCQKLTKADVQPFFTVPIATELPDAYNTATTKGCSFSVAGAFGTTLSIKVVVGGDAQTMQLLQKNDTQAVTFSGVGVTAHHPPGSTEFTAQEGTDADPEYCGVSTTGWKELAGKKDLPDVTSIPDATATMIAQQYGTLCNKLFGSGDTAPTMTVAAPVTSSSAPYTGVLLPTAGTIGTGFPLPQGLDCSGSKTTTDSEGTVTCDTTTTDGKALYEYYLQTLPAKGYVLHHEGESASNGARGGQPAVQRERPRRLLQPGHHRQDRVDHASEGELRPCPSRAGQIWRARRPPR